MSESSKMASIQNSVFTLGEEILEFCKEYSAEKKNGMIVNIWALMSHLRKKDSEEMEELTDSIKEVPIAYHSQALRVVAFRYAVEDLKLTDRKVVNKSILRMRDVFVSETENFVNVTHRIPSPFEIIYLVFNHIFMQIQRQEKKNNLMSLFMVMLNNREMQNQVLLSYLADFDDKYSKELLKGVF